MSVIDRVKILVLGDTGVGKTSFVNLAAHNEPLKSPSWTVGCSVEVKLHEYKEGTKEQKTYFLEFWDIGGSQMHRNARSVFYYPSHGVILVHDLTNRKSEQNLKKWLREIVNTDRKHPDSEFDGFSLPVTIDKIDQEAIFGNSTIPLIVIGTKLDQIDDRKSHLSTVANHLGVDEIVLDNLQTRYLAAGTSNAVKLSRFYDKVIETKSKSHKDSFSERLNSNAISPRFYSPHQE